LFARREAGDFIPPGRLQDKKNAPLSRRAKPKLWNEKSYFFASGAFVGAGAGAFFSVVLLLSDDLDSVVDLVAVFFDFFVDFFLVEVDVVAPPFVSVVFVSLALVSVFASGAFVGAGAAAWASMPAGSASAALIARAFIRAFFIAFSFLPRSTMPGLEDEDREAPVNPT
jgi:hypothetical protein